jgi:DNA-binding beta-propeller fold protein YncE
MPLTSWKIKSVVLHAAFLFLVLGCAGSPDKRGGDGEEFPRKISREVVWPKPPAQARIAYVRSFASSSDLKDGGKTFLKMAMDVILGPKLEKIIKPFGVAVDSKKRLVVADSAFRRIHIFDIEGNKYKMITRAGGGEFQTPIGVAVDNLDNIYVADSAARKVFVFNARGGHLFDIDGFDRPTGLAVNGGDGVLYVVDSGDHNVKVFDLKGALLRTIGTRGGGDGEFNHPVGICLDRDGDLYVTDTMNFRVQIFDKHGNFINKFGKNGDGTGSMARPKGIAVDRDGNIYIADALFDTIQIFNRDGAFLLNFGAIGRGDENLWMPAGLYIDASSRIYAADAYNGRVQIYEYLGEK